MAINKSIALALVILFACCYSSANAQNKFTKSDNAKQALGKGTITTSSGLQYKDLVIGKGKTPRKFQTCEVHFVGTLYPSGKKFDSSRDRNTPFRFTLGAGQYLKGWDLGVASMKVGGKRLLLIPPELGYGNRRVGKVPANSTLQFEVELLAVH